MATPFNSGFPRLGVQGSERVQGGLRRVEARDLELDGVPDTGDHAFQASSTGVGWPGHEYTSLFNPAEGSAQSQQIDFHHPGSQGALGLRRVEDLEFDGVPHAG